MRYVYCGHGIGAYDPEQVSDYKAAQRLLRLENRQGALKASNIQCFGFAVIIVAHDAYADILLPFMLFWQNLDRLCNYRTHIAGTLNSGTLHDIV